MNQTRLKLNCVLLGSYLFAGCLLLALTKPAEAQAQGDNAVYNSSGNCSTNSPCIPSQAFVDASVLFQVDICNTIYRILNGQIQSGYIPGGVIDARGVATPQTCASGTSPWFQNNVYLANKPSTILLPAGTIYIPYNWILPSGTRLIGVGTDLAGSQQTVIRCTGALCGPSLHSMIQFGGTSTFACSPSPCTGISVEHVTLDGANSTTLTGIENVFSQDQTYVDHVTFWQILATGLYIHLAAQNSGPYTNITYDTNGAASSTAVCVNINGVGGGTHGVHGLTCKSANYSPVAVFLDSSNNSLEDVRIMGFDDGIRIGSLATAQSNVLFNILGDTVAGAAVINVIHIWNSPSLVSDLSIMGASNQAGGGVITIRDDLTTTHLSEAQVGMYVLGKQLSGVGSPRFTTSPHAATWAFHSGPPPTTGVSGTCATGSLYSDSSGGGLYVCDRTTTWVLVKN
jgi:hypothetical protein